MILDGCPMFVPAYMGRKRNSSNAFTPCATTLTWRRASSERRLGRMPQTRRSVLLVPLAVGEADQLKLHAPRRKKINPRLPRIGSGSSDGGLAQKPNTLGGKISHCGIEIIYIES